MCLSFSLLYHGYYWPLLDPTAYALYSRRECSASGAYLRTAPWLRRIIVKVVLEILPVMPPAFSGSYPLYTIAESQHSLQ